MVKFEKVHKEVIQKTFVFDGFGTINGVYHNGRRYYRFSQVCRFFGVSKEDSRAHIQMLSRLCDMTFGITVKQPDGRVAVYIPECIVREMAFLSRREKAIRYRLGLEDMDGAYTITK